MWRIQRINRQYHRIRIYLILWSSSTSMSDHNPRLYICSHEIRRGLEIKYVHYKLTNTEHQYKRCTNYSGGWLLLARGNVQNRKETELHASKVYLSLLKLIISAVISTCNKSNSNIGLDTFISLHKEKFNSWCMGLSGLKIFSETARCIERVLGWQFVHINIRLYITETNMHVHSKTCTSLISLSCFSQTIL